MINELKFHPNKKLRIEEYLRNSYNQIVLPDSVCYSGTITRILPSKSVQPAFTKHKFRVTQIDRKNLIILKIEIESKLSPFYFSLVILILTSLFGIYLKSFIPLLFGLIVCVFGIMLLLNNNEKSKDAVITKIQSELNSIFKSEVD